MKSKYALIALLLSIVHAGEHAEEAPDRFIMKF